MSIVIMVTSAGHIDTQTKADQEPAELHLLMRHDEISTVHKESVNNTEQHVS